MRSISPAIARLTGVFLITTTMFCPDIGGAQDAAEPQVSVASAWLLTAAGEGERLVAGPRPEGAEQLLYTLRFRYEGQEAAAALAIVHPVPAGERYVADSATGPRAAISYSVDGGRSFGAPGALRVAHDGADPAAAADRAATPADYSHIRWELPGPHPPGLAGLVSFRTRSLAAELPGREAP